MKIKTLLVCLIFVLSILVTQKVEAISGACSYHGGVDCNAGSDHDGSVICNDGWRDSSVGYYETSMCGGTDLICTPKSRHNVSLFCIPDKI